MIKIERLAKAFGPRRAVDDISFTVERGEVLGFLGPNGAGKSTTMRMITGFMPPTAGRVTVGGYDVAESPLEAKRLIGYLPENAAAYPDMTVKGFLDFAAALRRLEGEARRKAVQRVVELAAAVRLSARGATEEKLAALGRVERLDGALRIYPRDKANAAELAQGIVELVNREGWKVEGMYSEAGQLDEVFRRITLPDTVKR